MEAIPLKPRPPKNAYFRFRDDKYDSFRSQFEGRPVSEVAKAMTEAFRALSAKEMEKYSKPYEQEKAAWDRVNEDYMAKYGELIKQHKKEEKRKEQLLAKELVKQQILAKNKAEKESAKNAGKDTKSKQSGAEKDGKKRRESRSTDRSAEKKPANKSTEKKNADRSKSKPARTEDKAKKPAKETGHAAQNGAQKVKKDTGARKKKE